MSARRLAMEGAALLPRASLDLTSHAASDALTATLKARVDELDRLRPRSAPPAGIDEEMFAKRLAYLRADAAARATVRGDERGAATRPPLVSLATLLEEPDEEAQWRVKDLWPASGRVVLSAPMKSGKTTLVGNLVRALADGTPFLGEFETVKAAKVALLDNEMDKRQTKRWLRNQEIVGRDDVVVVSLKGAVATFDIIDPLVRSEWAKDLRDAGVDVVIFDCLRPVLDAIGLSEDKDAGKFLVAFDALLREADVADAVVVHHTGHDGTRSRGDSRIRDWPDAEWRIRRDTTTDHGPRTFSAFGRDVDLHEGGLMYDRETRHLTYTAGKGLIPTAADSALPKILSAIQAKPGITTYRMREDLKPTGVAEKAVTEAAEKAVAMGLATVIIGARKARQHHLTEAGREWLAKSEPDPGGFVRLPGGPGDAY